MKKTFKVFALVWCVLLVLFNLAAFLVGAADGAKFDLSFWLCYAIVTFVMLEQLACGMFFSKMDDDTQKFCKLSHIAVVYIGTIVCFLFGSLVMVVEAIPNFVGSMVCAAAGIFSSLALAGVNKSDDKQPSGDVIKEKTFFIRSLTADAELLIARAKTDEMKALCKKVYEAVRYSDPMSADVLKPVENELTTKFADFSAAVNAADIDKAQAEADEVLYLVDKRNKQCKLYK